MRKKILTSILFAGILLGVFSPLLGTQSAYAFSMENVFLDSTGNNQGVNGYLVNTQNLNLTLDPGFVITPTTAKFKVHTGFEGSMESGSVPTDNNGDGKVSVEEETGGFDSIVGDKLDRDTENGIFLTIGTGVDANNKYVTGAVNYTMTNMPTPFTLNGNGKTINIGSFIWGTDPANNFFGKDVFDFNIVATGLTKDTQYYAQLFIVEDADNNTAHSAPIPFKTAATVTAAMANQNLSSGGTTSSLSASGTQAVQGQVLDNLGVKCEATSPSTWFTGCPVHFLYSVFYTVSGWLLSGAGLVFDTFAAFSLGSNIYKNPTFIYEGWRIVRDLSNMFFIFILLFISIGIILNLHSVNAKKMLAHLIVIALIINFSLFFTRVAIDASNGLARVFYNEINITSTGVAQGGLLNTQTTGDTDPKSISGGIAKGLNVSGMLGQGTFKKLANNGKVGAGTVAFVIIMGIIINLVAAWTFLQCAIFFVGRILGLWFSMIFSPLAFVSSIVPTLSKKLDKLGWEQWTSNLISLSIMAPVFMFFMYIIIAFLQSDFLSGLAADSANFGFFEYIIAMVLQFMLIIGLLQTAKNQAKKMSGEFGEAVASAAKGVAAVAGGAVAVGSAGAAMVGQRYFGARAADALESKKGGLMKAAAGGDEKAMAQLQLDHKEYSGLSNKQIQAKAEKKVKDLQKTSTKSYDFRQSAVGNALAGATGFDMNPKIPGIGTDKFAGGYQGNVDRKTEERKKFIESLGHDKEAAHKYEEKIKVGKERLSNLEEHKSGLQAKAQEEKAKTGKVDQKTATLIRRTEEAMTTQKKNLRGDEKELAGVQKGYVKKYADFVQKNNGAVGNAGGNIGFKDGFKQMINDIKSANFKKLGKSLISGIQAGVAGGATFGFANPLGSAAGLGGALVGTVNGLMHGGILNSIQNSLQKFMGTQKINLRVAGNLKDSHYHAGHYNDNYKPANSEIGSFFKKLFEAKTGGGGGGGGGSHGGGGDHGHGGGGGAHH